MTQLTWDQVCGWRLARQHLLRRAERGGPVEVAARIGGLHAQLMSAAELSLWARVRGFAASDLEKALWRDRKLVKTWAMRGTLHLLPSQDLPLYVAARGAHAQPRPPSWYKYRGVSPAEMEKVEEGVAAVLSDAPMTRAQLADAVAQWAGLPKLSQLLRSGWGALLKPSAFRGDLCFGPSQGQNVTFVNPRKWIGDWPALDPDDSVRETARRFLDAYGPATAEEFARWWGIVPAPAKRLFRSLGDEIQEVDVEGWKAWALTSSIPAMRDAEAPDGLRLLPHFDPYTIAVAPHSRHLLEDRHRIRVYRPQAWISPAALVEGRIVGVWEWERKKSPTVVSVTLFAELEPTARRKLEDEAQRLGRFGGGEVDLKVLLSQ